MKKLNYLLFVCLFAFSAVFTSCEEDETNPFSDPSIAVKLTPGSSSAIDLTNQQTISDYETGEKLVFDIRFLMGDDKLKSIKIQAKIGTDNFTEVDSVLNEGLFSGTVKQLDYKYGTNVGNNEKTITFSTTDKKDRVANFSVTIKPKAVEQPGDYDISKATLMGAQKNTVYGSFFSVDLGEVFMLNAANTNSGKVDLVYYYGTKNFASIGAPLDTDVQTVFPTIANWSKRNDTRFFKVESDINFTSINDVKYNEAIESVKESNLKAATNISVGDVVAYKTEGGKTGLFKVEKLDTNNTGTITILLAVKK